MEPHDKQPAAPPNGRLFLSRSGIALLVFLGVGSFLLIFEHRAHIPGDYWLLGGLITLCLLMHGFMHSGRGDGGDSGGSGGGR